MDFTKIAHEYSMHIYSVPHSDGIGKKSLKGQGSEPQSQ